MPASAGLPFVVGVIHVVGVGDAIIGIEAVGGRQHFPLVAEMPLSEAGGGVILRLEVIGYGVLFRVQALPRGREEHVLMHPHPFRIAPSQERCSRGGAHRRGYHEAGELPPLPGDSVDVGSLDGRGAEAAQISVTLIISEYDDEIWFCVSGGA